MDDKNCFTLYCWDGSN